MSLDATKAVWKMSKSRLASRIVLLALADHCNIDGHAWPAIHTLCDMTGLSERTVQAALKELVALGEITIKPNAGKNGVNFYTMHLGITPAISAPPQSLPPAIHDALPPQSTAETPAKFAPEPSRTTNRTVREVSADGLAFADWFRSTLPSGLKLSESWRQSWGECYDKLIRLDSRLPDDIKRVSHWGRSDSFWSRNFMSPMKLRDKDKNGVSYFDRLMSCMGGGRTGNISPSKQAALDGRHYPGPQRANIVTVPDDI